MHKSQSLFNLTTALHVSGIFWSTKNLMHGPMNIKFSSLLSYCINFWPTATFLFSFCVKRFYLYTHFVWAPSPKGKGAGHESDHSFHLVPML